MATQDTATEKCRPARTEITTDSSGKQNSENGSDVRVKPARLFSTTAASFLGVWWQFDSSNCWVRWTIYQRMWRWVQCRHSKRLCCNFNRQIRLKRNWSFSKVALDNRDGEEFILCEFDDLVFEFDCKATSGCGVHTTGSLSKKPGTCCPRSVLYCTTCTGGSNSADRNTRRHAYVHERSYASCETWSSFTWADLLTFGVQLWGPPVFRSDTVTFAQYKKCDISVTEMLNCKKFCRGFHVNLSNCLFAFGIGFRLSWLRGFIAWSNKFYCHCHSLSLSLSLRRDFLPWRWK